jgi:ketosteroid isomerase-like protein
VRSYRGTFDEYKYEVEKLTDAGGGSVVAVIHERGRGRGSGAPVARTIAILYTVIDGKIVRLTHFHTEGAALQAVDASP